MARSKRDVSEAPEGSSLSQAARGRSGSRVRKVRTAKTGKTPNSGGSKNAASAAAAEVAEVSGASDEDRDYGETAAAAKRKMSPSRRRSSQRPPSVTRLFPMLRDAKTTKRMPPWIRWLMSTRAGGWLADLRVEEHGKRRLAVAIVIWSICCTINAIVCNVADIRRTNALLRGAKLQYDVPDIGHSLIPHLTIPFLPDYFIIGLTVPTLVMILRNKHRLMVLRRFFYVHGVLCLFRSFTILVTTLPDPSPRCQVTDRPLRLWYEMFNPLFSETCGDLMFSGHTVMISLLTLAWTDYGFSRKCSPRRRLAWLTAIHVWALFGLAALLAARYHYTIDIVIAAYAAHRTWRIYGYIANSPTLLENAPLIKLLERRSSEGTMDEWVEQLGQARERVLTEMRGVQSALLSGIIGSADADGKASAAAVARGRSKADAAKLLRRSSVGRDGNASETDYAGDSSDSDTDGDFSLRRIGQWLVSA